VDAIPAPVDRELGLEHEVCVAEQHLVPRRTAGTPEPTAVIARSGRDTSANLDAEPGIERAGQAIPEV